MFDLKGGFHEKKVFDFLLESDRPSKNDEYLKKTVGQNFHYIASY